MLRGIGALSRRRPQRTDPSMNHRLARHLSPILLGLALLAVPASLAAQGTAIEKARSLIEALTRRQSLPPVDALGQLETAPADVCREIGEQLPKLPKEDTARITSCLAEATNDFAHASLLVGIVRGSKELQGSSLTALMSLGYEDLVRVGPAASQLMPGIFEKLRETGIWGTLIQLDPRARETTEMQHQQLALALIIDLYGGEGSFKSLVDSLVKLMVGEPLAEEPSADEKTDEEDEDAQLERTRVEIMNDRRRGALAMFRRLIVVDPDGFFQLGMSSTYPRRVEQAGLFWKKYGGATVDTTKPELEAEDSVRLINNDYVAKFGEVTTWRDHLRWLQRQGSTRDEQITALIIMDDICGGVMVTLEKPPAPAGTPPGTGFSDEPPPKVPAFKGETTGSKISAYLALDARTGQRIRARAVKKAFDELFPPIRK
jgi:hypothetical protein